MASATLPIPNCPQENTKKSEFKEREAEVAKWWSSGWAASAQHAVRGSKKNNSWILSRVVANNLQRGLHLACSKNANPDAGCNKWLLAERNAIKSRTTRSPLSNSIPGSAVVDEAPAAVPSSSNSHDRPVTPPPCPTHDQNQTAPAKAASGITAAEPNPQMTCDNTSPSTTGPGSDKPQIMSSTNSSAPITPILSSSHTSSRKRARSAEAEQQPNNNDLDPADKKKQKLDLLSDSSTSQPP